MPVAVGDAPSHPNPGGPGRKHASAGTPPRFPQARGRERGTPAPARGGGLKAIVQQVEARIGWGAANHRRRHDTPHPKSNGRGLARDGSSPPAAMTLRTGRAAPSAPACVVISGASRGLGAALALRFAAPGVTLGLIARDAAALERVAAACHARGAVVRLAALDIRDAPAVAAAVLAWDDSRPIELVVANAGVNGGTTPEGAPEGWAAATRQVEVNLLGAMNLVEPLLPRLLARGRGGIGLIASVAALRGLPDTPAYCASKAGLRAWGEALRAAHGHHGVRVTVVSPGFFPSAMSERFLGPRPMQMPIERVAARVHRALRAGRGRATFPWPLAALLRAIDLLPAPLADRAIRRFRCRIAPERVAERNRETDQPA